MKEVNDTLRNRIGIFRISNVNLNVNIHTVMQMMRDVVVLIAERNEDFTQYVGVHPDFDAVPLGCSKPPEYDFLVKTVDGEIIGGEWTKIAG